ncbi:MAG: FkbM family methyltransferase [Pseudomonadota bacterium]
MLIGGRRRQGEAKADAGAPKPPARNPFAGDYPVAEDISYIARVGGQSVFFLTDDRYSRSWFYPRYLGGKLHEPFATRFLLNRLPKDGVFVDVGAHLGWFSLIAAAKARAVFALEALEFLIGRIHRNVAANHLSNVQILLAAAGAAPGFAPMPKTGGPGSEVSAEGVTSLVPMVRLDDYFTGEFAPDVVKIDTEGYEFHVLEGALRMLEKKPVLMVELHRKIEHFGKAREDVFDLLSDHGYRIHAASHRDPNAKLRQIARADVAQINDAMVFCD